MKPHLNLSTSDLDRAVSFYSILLDAKPAKKLRDYALFITEQPALELALDLRDVVVSPSDDVHYGICVETSEEVDRAIDRLTLAGLVASIEREETCCYANATKVWATDPDGRHWEVYTVHKEADTALSCCSGALPAVPPPKWSAPRCRSQASIGSGRQPLHAPMAAMRNLRLLTAILALMASVGNPRPASAGNVPVLVPSFGDDLADFALTAARSWGRARGAKRVPTAAGRGAAVIRAMATTPRRRRSRAAGCSGSAAP